MGAGKLLIGIELVLDPLASFLTLVVTVVSCLVLIHARQVASVEHPDKRVPYYSLVLLLLAGFCGILSTGDLFNLYVFLEISSLSGYGLVAIGDKRSPVSAYRYLILGSVGTGFYLLGIGFIYVMSGSLNMADLARILPHILDQPAVLSGLILMVTGIGLKMALFPAALLAAGRLFQCVLGHLGAAGAVRYQGGRLYPHSSSILCLRPPPR